MSLEGTKLRLIEALGNGKLLSSICDIYIEDNSLDPSSLTQALIELHSEKVIDLNDLMLGAFRNNLQHDFFILLHVYEAALPYIDCSSGDVVGCVAHLLSQAGNDLSIGGVFTAFTEFCAESFKRSHDALSIVLSDVDKYSPFISCAIVAAQQHQPAWVLDQIVRLVVHEHPKVRSQAYSTITQIELSVDQYFEKSLALLEESAGRESDASALAGILRAAISLGKKCPSQWDGINSLVSVILTSERPEVLYAASDVIAFDKADIQIDVFNLLVECLKNSSLEHKGITNNIDYLLANLTKEGNYPTAVHLLECLLLNNRNFEIGAFNYFSHLILKEHKTNLSFLVTRWFLSGKSKLCHAILDLVQGSPSDAVLSADTELLGNSDQKSLFVAQKAIGWLFTRPIAVTSFILSLYHETSPETQEELESLLFDPLLLSYTSDLKGYLETESEQPAYANLCNRLFLRLESYRSELKESYEIKELRAPPKNAEHYWKEFNRRVEQARHDGPKPFFEEICTVKHLLYGNSSIFYAYDGAGEQRRSEMQMHTLSHSAELPRMNVIDPEGLDYMLRVFRVRKLNDEANS